MKEGKRGRGLNEDTGVVCLRLRRANAGDGQHLRNFDHHPCLALYVSPLPLSFLHTECRMYAHPPIHTTIYYPSTSGRVTRSRSPRHHHHYPTPLCAAKGMATEHPRPKGFY